MFANLPKKKKRSGSKAAPSLFRTPAVPVEQTNVQKEDGSKPKSKNTSLFAPRALKRKNPTTSAPRKHVSIAPTLQPRQTSAHRSKPSSSTPSSTVEKDGIVGTVGTVGTVGYGLDRTGIDDSFNCKPEEEYNPTKPHDYIELAAKHRLQEQLEERDRDYQEMKKNNVTRMTGKGRNISNVPAWMSSQ
jgi:hypothetical protein